MYLLGLLLAAITTVLGLVTSPWIALFGLVGMVIAVIAMFADAENTLWQ